MPKVRRTKAKVTKKRSPTMKGKPRALKTKRRKNQRSSKREKIIGDTFQAWIDAQVKRGTRSPIEVLSSKATKMPINSMDEWLAKQAVAVEKEKVAVKLPLGSTDEWLQKQVSARLLSEEAAEAVKTSATVEQPSTTNGAQDSSQITSESNPSTTTSALAETQSPA